VAREDQTWTVDPVERVAYLFGGRAGDQAFADLWRYDLASDVWTLLQPVGPGPEARFGHVAVWDASRGLVVWSGQHNADRFFDDVWLYDPDDNAWQQLPGDGDKPLARYGSCGGISPDGDLWVSHGFTHDSGRFFDTKSYDLGLGKWFDQTPDGRLPVDRCLHDCFWARSGQLADQLVLYGGQTTGVAALGDMWSYDPAVGGWTQQPDPPAPARQLYALAVMAAEAFVFGGGDIDREPLSDLWRVDLANLAWTQAEPSGDAPDARSGATLIADPSGDRLLLFGGKDLGGEFGDLWQLSAAVGSTN